MQRLTEQGDPFDMWAASIKLLIMFVLLKTLLVLIRFIYLIILGWNLLPYVCINFTEVS